MTTHTKNIILTLLVIGIILGVVMSVGLWGIITQTKTDAERTREVLDSLQHEQNYRRFIDSLNYARNKEQLEKYLKEHPGERPRK